MARGKHSLHSYNSNTYDEYEDENMAKRKIIIAVVAVVVIAIVVFAIVCLRNSENKKEDDNNTVNTNTVTESMITTYQGYDVLGKIIIDEFEIEQYILDSREDNALECGVTKLYGGSLNNYGNFCIAGHNKSGVFEKLSEMEIGDKFKIVEPNLTETEYQITQIYTSEADDLKCLMQDDSKVEITLITCENASTIRLIVKAEEIKK